MAVGLLVLGMQVICCLLPSFLASCSYQPLFVVLLMCYPLNSPARIVTLFWQHLFHVPLSTICKCTWTQRSIVWQVLHSTLQKQKSLVQVRSLGDWLVHFCTNCRMDTFITHAVKTDRVFVSSELIVSFGNKHHVTQTVCAHKLWPGTHSTDQEDI